MKILLIILAFLLSSCVTTPRQYQEKLDGWIGMPDQTLIKSLGNPDNVEAISKYNQIFTYIKKSDPLSNDHCYGVVNVKWCMVSFFITDHIVKRVSWKGNGCFK